MLLVPEYTNNVKKKFTHRLVIGISCLLFLLIPFIAFKKRKYNIFFIFLLISIFSFIADTDFFGNNTKMNQYVKIIDNIFAFFGIIFSLYLIYIIFLNKSKILSFFVILGLLLSLSVFLYTRKYFRINGCNWIYVSLHSLWHILCIVGLIFILYNLQ